MRTAGIVVIICAIAVFNSPRILEAVQPPQTYITSFANSGVNLIERFNTDGSGVQTLYSHGSEPNGITVDALGGKMYWTDFQDKTVMRANLNGSSVQSLVTSGVSEPQGIAVDPFDGKIYWTDDGIGLSNTSSIKRANLDGSGVQNLFPSGIGQPYGISLDLVHGKMYWADNVGNPDRNEDKSGRDKSASRLSGSFPNGWAGGNRH